ncbi:MAG: PilZ domain-containing protein [Spirochaetes bacterium]|nr:PilZ domain-containing protein [Spirochaetota bacterium]
MVEKRRYPRYPCSIKTKFGYHTGNPDEMQSDTGFPMKGKGIIVDISRGGALIITGDRVSVGVPAIMNFKTGKTKQAALGTIVRTGLLVNNPTEVARRMAGFVDHGDAYVAVQFKEPIELSRDDL